jgi:hypothetical protein
VNARTPSSEITTFPGSNVDTTRPRTKVWRTQGYWNITTSNRGIVFNEGGSDFTATIAVAEYTSVTTFLAAVKTALEDQGAGTYTVTQTSTKRIQIASSLGTFNLKMADVGSTAYDVLGFAATNRTGATSYIGDYVRIAQYEFMTWDFGVETNPTAFCMSGIRNQAMKLSDSAILTLQGNVTDEWTSPNYSQALTNDDEVIFLQSDTGFYTSGGLRYWRLKIEDQNPNGYIEASTIFLGEYEEFTTGKAQFPLEYSLIDRTDVVFSEGGQAFSDIKPKTSKFGLDFAFLSKEDVEQLREMFDLFGVHKPFYIIIDKNEVFSSSVNRYVRFVRFDSSPRIALTRPNIFNVKIDVAEEL